MAVRTANIIAARAVSDAIRTSLGPRGMDKMIQTGKGETIVLKSSFYLIFEPVRLSTNEQN
jgi:chaperonin GroEL (HSP60 family)